MVRKKIDSVDIFASIACCCLAFISLYPMWYVLMASLSEPLAVESGKVVFWLRGFYPDNYAVIAGNADMWRGAANSAFYVLAGLALMLITTLLMSYPLSRPNLACRKAVVMFILITTYLNAGIIPSYLLITWLKLYNTIWAIILPGYSVGNIILCTTYLRSMPNDLAESAFIDGANNFQTLFHIYAPLAKPVLAVISIYTVVAIWNSWFPAMLYLPNSDLHPLQMYLRRVLVTSTVDLEAAAKKGADAETLAALYKKSLSAKQLKYAMIIFTTGPILLVYPMFQKYFVKGVMLGSLKG